MINYRNDHNQSIAGCHVHKFFIIKVKGCISSIINILNKVLNAYTFSLFSNIAQEDIKYNMSLISRNNSIMYNDQYVLHCITECYLETYTCIHAVSRLNLHFQLTSSTCIPTSVYLHLTHLKFIFTSVWLCLRVSLLITIWKFLI